MVEFQVPSSKFQVPTVFKVQFDGGANKIGGTHLDHRIQSPCYPEVGLPTTSRECGDREIALGARRNAASRGGRWDIRPRLGHIR
jgi:hypothetical protein